MKISRLVLRTVTLASLALVGASAANAQGISISFVGVSPGTGTNGAPVGQFVWDYQMTLSADTGIRTQEPSSTTFYDFNGITAATFLKATSGAFAAVPGDTFTAGEQLLGVTPPDVTPIFGDNPGLNNAVFLYSGANFSNGVGSPSVLLGDALIASTIGTTAGNFVGVTTGSLDAQFGNAHDDTGAVIGPNLAPPPTPEPGAWAMFVGMGVSSLAFARRRKARK